MSSSLTRHFFPIFSVGVLVCLVGCSQADDTFLTGGSKPTPPATETVDTGQTTKDPANDPADDSDNSADDSANTPTSPPSTPPTSPRPASTKYRLFCDERYPPYVTSVSSMASSTSPGASITLSENVAGKVLALEDHQSLLIGSIPKFGEAKILLSAKPVGRPERKVYWASVDLLTRLGTAREIAQEVAVVPQTAGAFERESHRARSFGVSDGGKYLLLGEAKGYRLVESASLKDLGLLAVGSAARWVNPSLRESDMTFSVSELDVSVRGPSTISSFQTSLFAVDLFNGPVGSSKVLGLKALAVEKNLRRPMVAVSSDAADAYVAIDTRNGIRVVSLTKNLVPQSQVFSIPSLPAKGRLASALGAWRDSTSRELRAAVAFESILPDSGPRAASGRYKIEQVFVRRLALNESTISVVKIEDVDYPVEGRRAIEAGHGLRRGQALSDLQVAPGGSWIFATFPGGVASNIYKIETGSTGSFFERVSSAECSAISVGVEP